MKWNALFFACVLLLTASVRALITQHGGEPLSGGGWAPGLEKVINHPARRSGTIGPLAPSAHFRYEGNARVLNEVMVLYAKSQQPEHTLYLTATSSDCDFELSVNQDGSGFLHFYAGGKVELRALKIPASIQVEEMRDLGQPINSDAERERRNVEKSIRDFMSERIRRKLSG